MENRTRCSFCDGRRHRKYLENRGPEVRDKASIVADPDIHRRASEKYRLKDPKKCITATTKSNRKIRLEVLEHYGKICKCCGVTNYEFLTLHHVNNDGATHRKEIGAHIYRWAKKNGFPNSLEVNCMNCNWAKGKYGYCPHEMERVNDNK